tara:strand:+ start:2754 stop:2912 length:159 start_codon:yes stop_codon:yes gene_type:complete
MNTSIKRTEKFTKEILKIKGGDFMQWHEGLSPIEKLLYSTIFKNLQKNERHR